MSKKHAWMEAKSQFREFIQTINWYNTFYNEFTPEVRMLICRTPFKILFGGGTDYPAWYKKHGSCVISTSINKYSYITLRKLPPFFDYKFRIRCFEK